MPQPGAPTLDLAVSGSVIAGRVDEVADLLGKGKRELVQGKFALLLGDAEERVRQTAQGLFVDHLQPRPDSVCR